MGLNATLDNNVSGYVFILNYLAGIRLCSTIQGLIVINPISLIKRSGLGGGIFRPLKPPSLSEPPGAARPPPSIFPSITSPFPAPSYLIPHATLPSPPSSCFLGAVCGRCHNRRWNRFICCNVVWAAAWHGAEQHSFFSGFFPSPPRQRARLLSLPRLQQFMCFQTGQSTPLRYAGLSFFPLPFSPPLRPSASHNLCSVCL